MAGLIETAIGVFVIGAGLPSLVLGPFVLLDQRTDIDTILGGGMTLLGIVSFIFYTLWTIGYLTF